MALPESFYNEFSKMANTVSDAIKTALKNIDIETLGASFDHNDIREALQKIENNLPESEKDTFKITSRFEKVDFIGINEGYKRDLASILKAQDELTYPAWGAGQLLAFAALDGMLYNYIENIASRKIGSKTNGAKLAKMVNVNFEGKEDLYHSWHRKDEYGRNLLAHGKVVSYPTKESFFKSLDLVVRFADAIKKGDIEVIHNRT